MLYSAPRYLLVGSSCFSSSQRVPLAYPWPNSVESYTPASHPLFLYSIKYTLKYVRKKINNIVKHETTSRRLGRWQTNNAPYPPFTPLLLETLMTSGHGVGFIIYLLPAWLDARSFSSLVYATFSVFNLLFVEHYLNLSWSHLFFSIETQLLKHSDSKSFSVPLSYLFPQLSSKVNCCAYVRKDDVHSRVSNLECYEFSILWFRLPKFIYSVYVSLNSTEYHIFRATK